MASGETALLKRNMLLLREVKYLRSALAHSNKNVDELRKKYQILEQGGPRMNSSNKNLLQAVQRLVKKEKHSLLMKIKVRDDMIAELKRKNDILRADMKDLKNGVVHESANGKFVTQLSRAKELDMRLNSEQGIVQESIVQQSTSAANNTTKNAKTDGTSSESVSFNSKVSETNHLPDNKSSSHSATPKTSKVVSEEKAVVKANDKETSDQRLFCENLRLWFDMADIDNDGHLNLREMNVLSKSIGAKLLTPEEFTELCMALQTNDHTRLSFESVSSFLLSVSSQDSLNSSVASYTGGNQIKIQKLLDAIVNVPSSPGPETDDNGTSQDHVGEVISQPQPGHVNRKSNQSGNGATSQEIESTVDIEEHLTVDKQIIQQIFKICDSNGDGGLNYEEMTSWSQAVGEDSFTQSDFVSLCEQCQCDPLKGISEDVFMNLIYGQEAIKNQVHNHLKLLQTGMSTTTTHHDPVSSDVSNSRVNNDEILQQIFNLCDRNNDGGLNFDEMTRWCKVAEEDTLTHTQFVSLCEQCECDPMKGLTFVLFQSMLYGQEDLKSKSYEHLQRLQNEAETAVVTTTENTKSSSTCNDESTNKESSATPSIKYFEPELLHEVLTAADVDNDGKISFGEMQTLSSSMNDGSLSQEDFRVLCEIIGDNIETGASIVSLENLLQQIHKPLVGYVHPSTKELFAQFQELSQNK